MSDPYAQLRAIDSQMINNKGNPQTLVLHRRVRVPQKYVDRRSGLVWPSWGPLPFWIVPGFGGWSLGGSGGP